MNKVFFRKEIIKLAVFILIIAVLHVLLLKNTLDEIYLASAPWKIYLFIVPLTFLGLFYIISKYKKDDTSMVKTFMGYSVAKIMASILFLFPWIIDKDVSSRPIIIQFFAIFFLILLMETRFLVLILNNSGNKIEKS